MTNDSFAPTGRQWRNRLEALVGQVSSELVISSPFISIEGAGFLTSALAKASIRPERVRILTDLSPAVVAQKANDPIAVLSIAEAFRVSEVRHLPRVHAKVYIADARRAIVTSGNLTAGGLSRNYEYGVEIADAQVVTLIRSDVLDYAELGTQFDAIGLRSYARRAGDVQEKFGKAQASITRSARRQLESALLEIGEDLIRRQLAGGPVHAVFSRTILHLLRRYGPMDTRSIHAHVRSIHPELCNDAIDRVIDGERYGKKWKHQVRSAQSSLRRKGWAELSGEKWRLTALAQ